MTRQPVEVSIVTDWPVLGSRIVMGWRSGIHEQRRRIGLDPVPLRSSLGDLCSPRTAHSTKACEAVHPRQSHAFEESWRRAVEAGRIRCFILEPIWLKAG